MYFETYFEIPALENSNPFLLGMTNRHCPPLFERPEFTQTAFFFGIVVAPSVNAFVFHDQVPAVFQLAQKIRIEFVSRGLQPEGEFLLAFKVPNPEFHVIHLIQCLSTKKILAALLKLTQP
jgi:hypothetical protein